ncbi:MAG: hypothetical protein R2827_09335 [Bdellovibrionales bacterium]
MAAIEPMIIKEDLELEKALESAMKSNLKTEKTAPVATSAQGSSVASEDQRQNGNHRILQLAKILAKHYKEKAQSKNSSKLRARSVVEKYCSLSKWEYEQSILGTTYRKSA